MIHVDFLWNLHIEITESYWFAELCIPETRMINFGIGYMYIRGSEASILGGGGGGGGQPPPNENMGGGGQTSFCPQ